VMYFISPMSAIQQHFSSYSDIHKIEDKTSIKQWRGCNLYRYCFCREQTHL